MISKAGYMEVTVNTKSMSFWHCLQCLHLEQSGDKASASINWPNLHKRRLHYYFLFFFVLFPNYTIHNNLSNVVFYLLTASIILTRKCRFEMYQGSVVRNVPFCETRSRRFRKHLGGVKINLYIWLFFGQQGYVMRS